MNGKSRSKFIYIIRKVRDIKFVMIEDMCKNGEPIMSVTNDIENVISDICDEEGINPFNSKTKFIYKDSMQLWDGYIPFEDFVHLGETHWLQAAIKMLNK